MQNKYIFLVLSALSFLNGSHILGSEIRIFEGRSFMMGNKARFFESPPHKVKVATFGLMVHEVTVREYSACVQAGACDAAFTGPWCNSGVETSENHPINCITWTQADHFCRWSGLRLPSEAEWEFAARSGGRDSKFPWGNESGSCDHAVGFNTDFGCGRNSTWEVCSKPLGSTQQGLCDMGGNVWEWTADDAHGDYQGAPSDSKPWLDTPRNSGVVYRGGGFMNFIPTMETTYRRLARRDSAGYEIGFRCAQSPR
jgi:formylglycine-generating enzyme required for sulfatase activity